MATGSEEPADGPVDTLRARTALGGPGREDSSSEQLALFDTYLLALPHDPRSVGEILFDLDRQARELLFDVVAEDAACLLRSWPETVTMSARLWAALPGRPIDPTASAALDQPLRRLVALSQSADRALQHRIWPGPGQGDARLTVQTRWVEHTARLMARYGGEVPAERVGPRRDIDAARAGITHYLYVTTHAVTVALRTRQRMLADVRRDVGWTEPRDRRIAADFERNASNWIRRLDACERALISPTNRVHHLLPRLTESSWHDPDAGRLERALSVWDIQCHRTLSRHPSAANLYLACRVQSVITKCAMEQLADLGDRSRLPLPVDGDELAVGGSTAVRAWSTLASLLRDFASPYDGLDPHLAAAAGEVRACVAAWPVSCRWPGTLIEGGLDRRELAVLAVVALQNAAELAVVVGDDVSNENLTGPARALSRRAHDLVASDTGRGADADRDVVWISPRDILRDVRVGAPAPVTLALRAASEALSYATQSVASSAVLATSQPKQREVVKVDQEPWSVSASPAQPDPQPPRPPFR